MCAHRHRSWAFTWNNYTQDSINLCKQLPYNYLVLGYEVAPTTNTPHIQGFVNLKSAKTMSALKAITNTSIHLEFMKTQHDSNRMVKYCKKTGKFEEFGVWNHGPPVLVYDNVKTISQVRFLDWKVKNSIQPRTDKPYIVWLYGPSGCGKSQRAISPNCYIKDSTQWWDGYVGQSRIVLDDWEVPLPGTPAFRDFLRLLDRYPYQGQFKGGYVNINSPEIFITTDKHPSYWLGEENNYYDQVIRRVDELINLEKK